ncbi:MAG TPA: branched-chain amino acid ABC transporter permease, partial [Actinomycetota bacterium]|nr:branched-chain amino acid ABC transporter permease [Actinomycetota bacterium]
MNDQNDKQSFSERRRQFSRRYRARRKIFTDARKEKTKSIKESIGNAFAPVTRPWRALKKKIDENRKISYPILYLLGIAIAICLPFISDIDGIPLWLQRATGSGALFSVALFTLFALGLNVVVGFAGLLDLGYVAFWAIGSYTAAILTGAQSYSEALQQGANFEDVSDPQWSMWMWGIILVALLVAVVAGVVLGSPTLRLRGDYLAIVTLGFGEIVRIVANNDFLGITGGPRGVNSIPHPELHLGPIDLVWGVLTDKKYYHLLIVFVALWIIAIKMLDNSRIGRAWVAIREDEIAAASMGVPIVRMKLAAFAIGACTAGVGGVIYAEQVNFINPPTFDLLQSILILSAVVIGGMGSVMGSILGAT